MCNLTEKKENLQCGNAGLSQKPEVLGKAHAVMEGLFENSGRINYN
jgi:hypothetical protein